MDRRSQLYSSPERAFLAGFYRDRRHKEENKASLDELALLADSAGAIVAGSVFFELRTPNAGTLIGTGKTEEISGFVRESHANLVIFDEDLTPTQNRNLEETLGVRVLDRTGLILDIFARRAHTKEGQVQVELAQLKYLLPRLTGRWVGFSRQTGGIGTRGPGETQLEVDQRKVRHRIGILTGEFKRLATHRENHRRKREGVPIPTVSLVGYTNAGKSTLMNRLTDAGVPVDDKLFVTLDPTTRRLKLPSGREILLADTVGFVRKLPHELVESFRATFEEAAASDLLLHLVDAAAPDMAERVRVVDEVLGELGLGDHPVLRIFNKIDRNGGCLWESISRSGDLFISAIQGDGIEGLLEEIDQKLAVSLRRVSLLIPHAEGAVVSLLYSTSRVLSRRDEREGVHLEAEVSEKYFRKFKVFLSP